MSEVWHLYELGSSRGMQTSSNYSRELPKSMFSFHLVFFPLNVSLKVPQPQSSTYAASVWKKSCYIFQIDQISMWSLTYR